MEAEDLQSTKTKYLRVSPWEVFGVSVFHFGRRSTLHGVNHIFNAKHASRRVYWLLITLAAIVGLTLNVHAILVKFLEVPILTSSDHNERYFHFPDITFCNLNPIYFPPEGTNTFQHILNSTMRYRYLSDLQRNSLSFSDFLYILGDQYSHPAWSLVVRCHYQNQVCNWTHFEPRSIWPYGLCYTFKPERLKLSHRVDVNLMSSGERPHFNVILYKAVEEIGKFTEAMHGVVDMPTGIMVMLHQLDTHPVTAESFLLDGCAIVDLHISWRSHMIRKNKTCKKTLPRNDFYFHLTNRNVSLLTTWAHCANLVIQETVFKFCRCLMFMYPIPAHLWKAPFCSHPTQGINHTQLNICLQHTYNHLKLRLKSQLHQCYVDECEHPTYGIVMAQPSFPAVRQKHTHLEWLQVLSELEARELQHMNNHSGLWKHALLQLPSPTTKSSHQSIHAAYRGARTDLLNVDFVERNFMMFRLVPTSMYVNVEHEMPEYPMSSVLTDIGGCIGLALGASLISLFEIMDLVLDMWSVLGVHHQAEYRRKLWLSKCEQTSGPPRNINQQREESRDENVHIVPVDLSHIGTSSSTTNMDNIPKEMLENVCKFTRTSSLQPAHTEHLSCSTSSPPSPPPAYRLSLNMNVLTSV